MKVKIIGAGLAGCEAALQLANRNIKVDLYEMKPRKHSKAHSSNNFAELVCSNSFRDDTRSTPNGILINELKQLHSYLIDIAYDCRLAKGNELIIDRDKFSKEVTARIRTNKNIRVHTKIVDRIDDNSMTIIATGPLTEENLSRYLLEKFGHNNLSFQDSTCPIIYSESIDFKNERIKCVDDKILISLKKKEFDELVYKLQNARIMVNAFDKEIELPQCCPIEYLAKKNPNQLLDVKLSQQQERTDDHYATVTLRGENETRSAYSISGFMTQMQHGSQNAVIRSIPGLEKCKFARYGRSHKNTYFNAPNLLDKFFKTNGNCYIIGQLSGIDGYVPAIATGIVAAYAVYSKINKDVLYEFPSSTMIGGFCNYITQKREDYTPVVASYHLLEQSKNYYNNSSRGIKKWLNRTHFIDSMQNYNYKIYTPSGNPTALVFGIEKTIKKRRKINDEILALYKGYVEQVGFVDCDINNPQLFMAGGGFCGNATRCAVYYYLNGKPGDLKIKVSGVKNKINAGIDENKNVWVDIPILKSDYSKWIKVLDEKTAIIKMKGITHVIIETKGINKKFNNEQLKSYSYEILKNNNLLSELTSGVLYVDYLDDNTVELTPVVYDRKVDTLICESACGSGAAAVGIYASSKVKTGVDLNVIQPSGNVINTKTIADSRKIYVARISGKVDGCNI